MRSKYFEVRDNGTLYICRADKFTIESFKERLFLEKGGWNLEYPDVVLTVLNGRIESNYDPYKWDWATLREAHIYIRKHFDDLENFSVVDMLYLRGEINNPRESEVLQYGY